MWAFQRHLIYVPATNIGAPEAYGLHDFDALRLTAADHVQVAAWYRKASPGYPTLIYYHGNGGHLGDRAHYFRSLTDAGFGLLALDYRGYGSSEGSPSEQGFYADARAAREYATKTLLLPADRIILYGESIGTGVAVQIASEYPSAGLVLQSPFASLETIAQDTYPWLPVHLLLQDRFDSISKIASVHAPLLLMHGEEDTIVPIASGKELFAQAHEPKEAVYFPRLGHNNLNREAMTKALLEFCNKYGLIHENADSAKQ